MILLWRIRPSASRLKPMPRFCLLTSFYVPQLAEDWKATSSDVHSESTRALSFNMRERGNHSRRSDADR